MRQVRPHTPVASWTEPDGVALRGTLIVLPGRGERPELYERFGRRIAADGYRVYVVADPAQDANLAASPIAGRRGGREADCAIDHTRAGRLRNWHARSPALRGGLGLHVAGRMSQDQVTPG
jgi:hypothetical protein